MECKSHSHRCGHQCGQDVERKRQASDPSELSEIPERSHTARQREEHQRHHQQHQTVAEDVAQELEDHVHENRIQPGQICLEQVDQHAGQGASKQCDQNPLRLAGGIAQERVGHRVGSQLKARIVDVLQPAVAGSVERRDNDRTVPPQPHSQRRKP